jgi:hypothetical protein
MRQCGMAFRIELDSERKSTKYNIIHMEGKKGREEASSTSMSKSAKRMAAFIRYVQT